MFLSFLTKYRDAGLLLMRLGLGVLFIMHGAPKIMGGPALWTKLGGAMKTVGIDFAPAFWGFMAAFAECFGGIFLILGLFFRPACILLAITMTIATMTFAERKDFFKAGSHPMALGVVFYSLILIGPGRFSIDKE